MPRVSVRGFLGPSNRLASITADAEVTYNWILEPTDPATDPIRAVWGRPRPGLSPFTTGLNGFIRALLVLDDGDTERAFAVAGSGFYEIFADGTATFYGSVTHATSNAASISTNGTAGGQVFIVSDGDGYIFDLNINTLTQITDPDFPSDARMGEFLDGYFLVLVNNSRSFQWSALEDGTSWDALDIAERSTAADNINAFLRVGRTLSLGGTRTSEPWYDQGDVNNPFAPIQGTLVNQGVLGPYTLQRVGEQAMWLGKNENGDGVVMRGDHSLSGTPVSPPAVNQELQNRVSPGDARGWFAQVEGHGFYVLTIPGELDASWVYDLLTNRWVKWAHWNSTTCVFEQFRGVCHMFAFGKHLVGDFQTGTIYELSFDNLTDELVAA